jgi:prepilin-type N-terminal cleavage/methylation domain-containing protein
MKLKNSNGFTLIELLIVIGIMAVLAAIAIMSMSEYKSRAIESAMQTELKNFSFAMEALFTDCGDYSSTLTDTTTGPGMATLTSAKSGCTSIQKITVGANNTLNSTTTIYTYVITIANPASRTSKLCIAMNEKGSYAWGSNCATAEGNIPP